MGKLKIKQIELKDVDLATLNENEVYYCDLNNFYIQDLFVEKILNQKLQEGKLSLTEFNCIVNYINNLIIEKDQLDDQISEMILNMR